MKRKCVLRGDGFFYLFGDVSKFSKMETIEDEKCHLNTKTIKRVYDIDKIIIKICSSLKKQKKEYFINYEYSEKE